MCAGHCNAGCGASDMQCNAGYMARYNKSPARQATERYMEVAKKYGLTPVQLALAWCNQRWTVTSTIIGATSLEQLKVFIMHWKSYLWIAFHRVAELFLVTVKSAVQPPGLLSFASVDHLYHPHFHKHVLLL